MRSFIYHAPAEVYFGKSGEEKIADICSKHGYKKVLIVYGGHSAVKSGLLDRVEKNLTEAGVDIRSEGGVVPNPLLSRVLEIGKVSLEFKPDMILAIGGGSVIDTAKAVAHMTANLEVDVWKYFSGEEKVSATTPVGCILTIPAAGSEMSDSCVITNDLVTPWQKRGLSTDYNRCVFAILNPELAYTLPKNQLGAGIVDIFMHTSERFFCNRNDTGNHMSDAIAIAVMKNIMDYGSIAYDDNTDYEAMSEVMWTGSLSHNDITGLGVNEKGGRGGDWSCHQLGMAMSALYNTTHGSSLSAVWPSWARYVRADFPERFAQYGREMFGLNGDDETVGIKAIAMTEEWFRSLDQPVTVSEAIGTELTDKVIEDLAMSCSRNKERTVGSLRVLDYDAMYEILKNAG